MILTACHVSERLKKPHLVSIKAIHSVYLNDGNIDIENRFNSHKMRYDFEDFLALFFSFGVACAINRILNNLCEEFCQY